MIGRMLGWLGWMWFDLRFVLVDTIWFESLVFPPMISETTRSNQLLVLVEKSVAALMSSNKKAFWGFSEIWESTHVFFNEGWRVFQVFHSLAEGSRTIRIHLFWDSDWSLNPLLLLILKSATKSSLDWDFSFLKVFSVVWNLFSSTMLSWTKSVQVRIYLFEDDLNYTKVRMPSIKLGIKFELPINWTHHSNWRLWHIYI